MVELSLLRKIKSNKIEAKFVCFSMVYPYLFTPLNKRVSDGLIIF